MKINVLKPKSWKKARVAAGISLCLLLAACGTPEMKEAPEVAAESVQVPENTASSTQKDEKQDSISANPPKDVATGSTPMQETVIDFPFPFGVEEGCKLTLACMDEEGGLYELRFYDKDGNLAQQLACGQLREPIRFAYDDLANTDYWYDDLEIFANGAKSGLLFIPDHETIEAGGLFLEEAIEIPVYAELLGYPGIPCTFAENETQWEKVLYDIDVETKSTQPLRRMTLQKESGLLEIWDYLDKQNLYSGEAVLKEDGSLANPEYYHYLFSDSVYRISHHSETASKIPVWFSYTDDKEEHTAEGREKNRFEKIQEAFWGNNGHMAEYEDRETFLSDFGFAGQEPFYCYSDKNGNLQLELYLDEKTGCGCGLSHTYHYTGQQQKADSMYGFAFDTVSEGTWTPRDPFQLTNVYGETGKEAVEEYEERIDYREDGTLDTYQSFGIVDWLNEEMELPPDEKIWMVKIHYIFRDDGTLFYRDYSHNSRIFATTGQSCDSYYDALERPVYETAYITHGRLKYYYIYDDTGKEPAYQLCLDDNLGYYIPECVRYH